MATEIIMPKAGMDMEEGTVIKWLKTVGDSVEVGEPILEILTDKVNMEVEAEVAGTIISVTAQEGDVLPVFTVIGYIGNAGEEVSTTAETIKEEKATDIVKDTVIEEESKVDVPVNQTGKFRATPAARKLARDRGIFIGDIPGNGPLGRVQLADVEEFNVIKATPLAKKISQVENIDLSQVKGTGIAGKITKDDIKVPIDKVSLVEEKIQEQSKVIKENIIPMVGLRKIIAERMKDSLNKSAPVTLNIEVDMTNASQLREKLKDIVLKEIDKKLSLTDLIIMATSKALMKYPIVNATLVEEGILINDNVNMGIAVGLDNGLLVPVIRGTDKMTLKEIVTSRSDIVKRTLNNKVKPDELNGSSFTISNLGMFDTLSFTSIINQPNSAILSVGTTSKRMRVIGDEPQVRSVMFMSLTLDHRVMDGLVGAQFLQYLKDVLEDPTLLLL
ncbi:2-oxo acid dehydrogenase subunit E2 [Alkalibaculum sp. M08DMB]|uniref:Dihydrolipoamide acetyltransferase component of pyruvate dehydrogenase complex n=1 Tax=Alkalibaculum sporogenes TaxID=2655001 RepID=A0A6A7KD54_9FIRM|nr:2-oxo acid dehydrogenase subunit E2 [Alkalibaculum sporogenes]MPW27285.1 2-oxo acid dehydrogenase subunit E2 [Alkalibaculum sporogenes]